MSSLFKRKKPSAASTTVFFAFNEDGIKFLKDENLERARAVIGPLTRFHEEMGEDGIRIETIAGEEDSESGTFSICVHVSPAYPVSVPKLLKSVPIEEQGEWVRDFQIRHVSAGARERLIYSIVFNKE